MATTDSGDERERIPCNRLALSRRSFPTCGILPACCERDSFAKEVCVTEPTSVGAEEIVWRGSSSQWKNFGVYLLCGLLCWLIVPIFFALVYYLRTRTKVFELTTQRLKVTSGIFTKVTETLELYRVKDIETRQPFFSRLVGIENVQMTTSDASSPTVLIEAVPSSVRFADKLRNQVEIIRQQKRVREIDIDQLS